MTGCLLKLVKPSEWETDLKLWSASWTGFVYATVWVFGFYSASGSEFLFYSESGFGSYSASGLKSEPGYESQSPSALGTWFDWGTALHSLIVSQFATEL